MTGPEIFEQLDGNFDAFVAGMGTGGTITGIGRALKERKKEIQIVGVDPIGSILHDYFKTGKTGVAHTYKVEGIGEDFIPKNYDFKYIDDIMQINDKESFQMTRRLLVEEGLYCGVSSGSAVCGALKYARKVGGKKRIVVLLPDSGNRYMSKVFDDDWMKENGFFEEGLGTVRDLLNLVKPPMKDSIITAVEDDSIEKIITLMNKQGISQIPVMKGKEILGLVSESGLLSALFSGKVKREGKIKEIIDNKFVKVTMSEDMERISQSMNAGLIPIVIEGGDIVSIVTKIDLINYLGKMKSQ
jgi:cystathionine beta-synthase